MIEFMRDGTSRDPGKGEVLRPILKAHGEDRDPRWRTLLLVIFWPGLESISYRKRRWDPDPDERWSNIVWTFLQVICRLDLAKRSRRLVQKVINETAHRLHDEYRRAWTRAERELSMDHHTLEAVAGPREDAGLLAVQLRDLREAQIERLRKDAAAGRITETDLHLIIGTRIYGKRLRDCAGEAGLTYEAAKKRRQRAEAAITRPDGNGPE